MPSDPHDSFDPLLADYLQQIETGQLPAAPRCWPKILKTPTASAASSPPPISAS